MSAGAMNVEILRWLVSRYAGGFVLVFHEIQPEQFGKFVDCLHPFQPIPLSELLNRATERRSTSGLFSITIDDGIADTAACLAVYSISRSWPVTIYVPARYAETGERMAFQWWRRIEPLIPHRPIKLSSGTVDFSRAGSIAEFSRKMVASWYTQRLESYMPTIQDLIDLLVDEEGVEWGDLAPPPVLCWEQIERLSKSSLVQFESHGVSHTAMSALTEEELETEMKLSRDAITEHTNVPCTHLAYPFGSDESIGPAAVRTARRFYRSASTMNLGSVDGADPWRLPRIPLYETNSQAFARLKILLGCGPLRTWRA